jgi:hypothetical protein
MDTNSRSRVRKEGSRETLCNPCNTSTQKPTQAAVLNLEIAAMRQAQLAYEGHVNTLLWSPAFLR